LVALQKNKRKKKKKKQKKKEKNPPPPTHKGGRGNLIQKRMEIDQMGRRTAISSTDRVSLPVQNRLFFLFLLNRWGKEGKGRTISKVKEE